MHGAKLCLSVPNVTQMDISYNVWCEVVPFCTQTEKSPPLFFSVTVGCFLSLSYSVIGTQIIMFCSYGCFELSCTEQIDMAER